MAWLSDLFSRWLRGRFVTTITRRVSDEEVVALSFSSRRLDRMKTELGDFLGMMRTHMLEHNERVVMAFQQRIRTLESEIDMKGRLVNDCNAELERIQAIILRKRRGLHPTDLRPVPGLGDPDQPASATVVER